MKEKRKEKGNKKRKKRKKKSDSLSVFPVIIPRWDRL